MRVIAWDTETALFRPGVMAPELACVTWQSPGLSARIAHWTDVKPRLKSWLEDKSAILVGHNVAYDMAVIGAQFPDLVPLIFVAYAADRVTDTMLRQKLLDIAGGCYRGRMGEANRWIKYDYSLLAVTKRHTGRLLEKDEWRLKYGELRNLPLDAWPEGARLYPLDDATATLDVYTAQERHADPYLKDQYRQARKAWWLHLTSAWGLRTKPEGVEILRLQTERALAEVRGCLEIAGLVREDGSRDTKAAAAYMIEACEREWIPVRRTPADGVSLDSDACEATGDPLLKDYADLTSLASVLNKDVKALAAATIHPVHTRFDIADTGRSTSSSPNVQNWRRLPGIRECFVPRRGYVYAQADYPSLELYTLAQACMTLLGRSALGDALRDGLDPHTALAANILGISLDLAKARRKDPEDKQFDDARQTAKVANFGFPGGLGAAKLVLFARKTYNVSLTEARAKELKAQWLETWPEMPGYFAHINQLTNNPEQLATVEQLFTGRIRGGARFCAACNSYFQGLGADASAEAGYLISHACYVDTTSPLFGSRLVNYVHDEFIAETRDTPVAHGVAHELARLMLVGVNKYLPDVPMKKVEPLLMRYWSKEAKPLFDASGRLVPWGAS